MTNRQCGPDDDKSLLLSIIGIILLLIDLETSVKSNFKSILEFSIVSLTCCLSCIFIACPAFNFFIISSVSPIPLLIIVGIPKEKDLLLFENGIREIIPLLEKLKIKLLKETIDDKILF